MEQHKDQAATPLSPVEILKQRVGDTLIPPPEFLPENSLPGVECRKDDKTGLAIFEGAARSHVVKELGEVMEKGGEVVQMIYDCDDLKGANDRFDKKFGDYTITWGASSPLHEIKKLGLSCRIIAMRPTGSPDDTLVFFENPTPEDKQKIIALNEKLNDKSSGVEITAKDKKGSPRPHTLSVTSGLAFSPQDNREVMRRRRTVNYDGTPNLTPFTEKDLEADLADLKQGEPEIFNYTVVEGLIQVANDRALEAKGRKQLDQAEEFLESLTGLPLKEFNLAVRKRFAGSRTSDIVWETIDNIRTERYSPPE